MANLNVLDANGSSKYLKGTGAGDNLDPFIPEHKETSAAAILAAVDGVEALLTTIDADTSALAATAGTVAISNATVAVTQSGTWNIGSITTLPNVVVGSGTVVATGPLTDTELRATPIPVSGTLTASISDVTVSGGTVVATGPLTDTELRATPVPVSGTVATTVASTTITSGTVVATGPLTDTELRATPVLVGGTVAATQSGTWNIGTVTTLPNVVVGSGTVTATVASTTITAGTVAATQSGAWNIGTVTTLPNVVVGSGTVVATVSGATIASGTITAQESKTALTWVTGTVSASGDSTIIAAPGSGTTIAISAFQAQLEGATAQTLLMKFGTVTKYRALLQNQGDGVGWMFPPGREWRPGDNAQVLFNLSGTPAVGYTMAYWKENV